MPPHPGICFLRAGREGVCVCVSKSSCGSTNLYLKGQVCLLQTQFPLSEGPFLLCSFAGYQTRGCSQPSEVNFTLNMLVSAVPVGLILLGLLLFKLYPIDEEKRRKNKKALQDLR